MDELLTSPLALPHITRHPLTALDWQNLKAAKAEVAPDVLVQLTPWQPGGIQALAFGYGPESNDLATGTIWHCIGSAHHATLVPALRAMIFGLDDEWLEDVWNVEMIGGK